LASPVVFSVSAHDAGVALGVVLFFGAPMPIRRDRRGRGGGKPPPKPPTPREWSDAALSLVKHRHVNDADATMFEFAKSITRGGKTWTQKLWLNIHQLHGIARDHAD
jgi:hypothetical protein